MDVIVTHLQQHWRGYTMGAIVVLPLLVYFRKYAFPIIQYAIEWCVYTCAMHCSLWLVLSVVSWFVDASTMKHARGLEGENLNPKWTVPIPEFWDKALYNPHWMYYAEIVLALLIIVLIWRYRPMKKIRKPLSTKPVKKLPGNYQRQMGGRR